MSIFTGSGTAICTPFDSTGAFNGTEYERLIEFQIEKGTDAIVSCGTTGEASTLSKDEHIEAVRTAVSAAKKIGAKYGRKVPVIAGVGGNNTADCVLIGKKLQQAGADAIMCVTPYYNKTSQKGLVAHYSIIASNVDVPIMLYNVPSRTGMNLQGKTLYEISKIPNVKAIKEASGDFSQIAEMAGLCGDSIDIYSGNDDHILPILALGGKGVVSTVSNIIPGDVHNIVEKFMAGDIEGSRKLQFDILPLISLMFADVNPMPVKAALNIMGFNVGECRLPLVGISEVLQDSLKDEMKRYGLI